MTPTAQAAPSVERLSEDQRSAYHSDGYLVLPAVFSTVEIAELADECDTLLARKELIHTDNIRCRWQNHVDTGECMFECYDPVADIGPVCDRIARDRRIIEPLSQIYGCSARLFKDKLIYKPPGAVGYGLHQDYIGWKDFPKSFITVLVAIDAADDDNGATTVYPGVHHNGYQAPLDGMYHETPRSAVEGIEAVPLRLQPGDIAFFGCFTPHFSSPNRTDRWRRQLYLSYNADSEGGNRRAAHYREFHAWLKERYAEYGKHNVYFR